MSISVMKQALEALEMGLGQVAGDYDLAIQKAIGAVTALRTAIEQAEQQRPVADDQPLELVRIEHWRQDTMESGHWEKTREMPRHIAERLLHHFDQASITAAPEKGGEA